MSMAFCRACGHKIDRSDHNCGKCQSTQYLPINNWLKLIIFLSILLSFIEFSNWFIFYRWKLEHALGVLFLSNLNIITAAIWFYKERWQLGSVLSLGTAAISLLLYVTFIS